MTFSASHCLPWMKSRWTYLEAPQSEPAAVPPGQHSHTMPKAITIAVCWHQSKFYVHTEGCIVARFSRAAPIPRRGRRAGGISDDPAPSMAEPPQTSARPIEEDSTTGGMDFGRRSASIKREPSVASRQSAGFGLDDNGGDELPGLGLNSAQEPSKGFLDTGPSFAPVGSPLTEPLVGRM